MIEGEVGPDGLPRVFLTVGRRELPAQIDTGFNGDLEMPQALGRTVEARYDGAVVSVLADGRRVLEDNYRLDFPFDGELVSARATFAPVGEILVGTRLLRRHRLEIDFEARSVMIRRAHAHEAGSAGT